MPARLERRPHDERARNVRLTVELCEYGSRQLGVVLISDRNALSAEVASMRAGDPGRNSELRPGIDLARRDLDRARALTVFPDCLCRHGVNVILKMSEKQVLPPFPPCELTPDTLQVTINCDTEFQAQGIEAAF